MCNRMLGRRLIRPRAAAAGGGHAAIGSPPPPLAPAAALTAVQRRRLLSTSTATNITNSGTGGGPPPPRPPLQAVIAGAGVGGLALAYFLRRVGIRATVVERRGEEEPDPAAEMGLGVWVNALRCLAAGGLPLPQALAAAGHPHTWMLDSGYTSVDGAVLAKPGTALVEGQLLFCRRGHLLATLKDAALAAGAELRYGEGVQGFNVVTDEDKRAVVHVATTKTAGGSSSSSTPLPPADVLIGAEGMGAGAGSVVRRGLLGGGGGGGGDGGAAVPASRGYVVYRGVAVAEGGGGGPLAPGFSFQTWGPASRFASVPLADGQVWFATLPITFDQDAQDAQLQRQRRLLDHFGGWHAPIPALLAATPPGSILFDHAVAHRSFPPFNSSHSNDSGGGASGDWPVTVVGDAAHGVDPILAQGAGVAVEDAYALACALGGVGKGGEGDVAAALRAYERATRGRAELLTLVSDLSQALSQGVHSPGLLALRDAAFRLAPQAVKGPLFDFFIRLSLARTPGEAWSAGRYGYTPAPLPVVGGSKR